MYQLTAKSGGEKGASWPISEIPLVMGRGKDCDVRVREIIVSRKHCELWQEGEVLRLRDLGSTNATLVNGQPSQEAILQVGDELSVGGHVFVITQVHDNLDSPTFSSDMGGDAPLTANLSSALYLEEGLGNGDTLRLPRSIYEFRDLFLLSRRFSRAAGVTDLYEVLCGALRERFVPDAVWLAQYLPRTGDLIFDPLEGGAPADSAPMAIIRAAIDRREGLLVPRSTHEGNAIRYETTMVAPLVLGEERVGALALHATTPHRAFDQGDLEFLVAVAHAFAPYLRAAERHDQLRRDYEVLQQRTAAARLIGESPRFLETLELLRKAAGTKLNVLLLGETGTGKELAARLVHDLSPRATGPFVVLNCPAIPRELFESEVFGHEKGAFTGAVKRRIGQFEVAHRGTLFLDEIADLAPDNQARLLRVLETGTFYRVGGSQEVRADVRVVAATNSPLVDLVASGRFREDLFHRLSGFEVRLPALRERPDDIPRLAAYFLEAARTAAGRGPARFAEEAVVRMREWAWPGNIRELRACVERAAALAQDSVVRAEEILLQAIPASAGSPAAPPLPLAELEKQHITHVLKLHQGNIRAAARALRISRPTLYRKIRQYGL